MNNEELENISSQVRRDIVRMVAAVKSGHPGGSLGCTDFLTFLYFGSRTNVGIAGNQFSYLYYFLVIQFLALFLLW